MAAVVDVVILTWDDPPEMIGAAVSSVLASGVTATVTVIDNGSREPSRLDADRVRLVRCPRNLGVSVGRTLGVALGEAPNVLFLDSDARLGPGALRRLLDVLDEEGIGIAGPAFIGQHPNESAGAAPTLRTKIGRALNRRSTYEDPGDSGPTPVGTRDVDFVIGACQVFRREVWEAIGGLDTTIFYGPEDVDFCLRAKSKGWRVVQVLDAEVHHPPRRAARSVVSARGIRHAGAVARHLWRHRRTGAGR